MPDISADDVPALRRVICVVLLVAAAASEISSLGLAYLPAAALPISLLLLLPAGALVSTWANIVTLIRTTLPAVCMLAPVESAGLRCLSGLLFVLLDFVDGALARRLGQASVIGGLLDEEADSFGTLVASAELIRLGLAPRWLAAHQGCAHYIFIIIERLACPGFQWHMPFARTAAGIMGVCLVGACVVRAANAPVWLGHLLGCTGCVVNAISFSFSYGFMAQEVLRRRREASREPRFVFATVGSLESTSGGYIFERLMYHGLVDASAATGATRSSSGSSGSHAPNGSEVASVPSASACGMPPVSAISVAGPGGAPILRRANSAPLAAPGDPAPREIARETVREAPPWASGAAELWELSHDHPLFGSPAPPQSDGAPSSRGAPSPPLLGRDEANVRFASLPRGSVVVLDGLALLQVRPLHTSPHLSRHLGTSLTFGARRARVATARRGSRAAAALGHHARGLRTLSLQPRVRRVRGHPAALPPPGSRSPLTLPRHRRRRGCDARHIAQRVPRARPDGHHGAAPANTLRRDGHGRGAWSGGQAGDGPIARLTAEAAHRGERHPSQEYRRGAPRARCGAPTRRRALEVAHRRQPQGGSRARRLTQQPCDGTRAL